MTANYLSMRWEGGGVWEYYRALRGWSRKFIVTQPLIITENHQPCQKASWFPFLQWISLAVLLTFTWPCLESKEEKRNTFWKRVHPSLGRDTLFIFYSTSFESAKKTKQNKKKQVKTQIRFTRSDKWICCTTTCKTK